MPSFCRKIISLLLPYKEFIQILRTKFWRCLLIAYFVTVDLVTSPKITALLWHCIPVLCVSLSARPRHESYIAKS